MHRIHTDVGAIRRDIFDRQVGPLLGYLLATGLGVLGATLLVFWL